MEEIAKDHDASSADDAAKPRDAKANKAAARPSTDAPPAKSAKDNALREWTDRSGLHKVQAKYLGTEDGKVRLEKADGAVISVPIESLSEADQHFIGAIK
jgi:hypothetical protein